MYFVDSLVALSEKLGVNPDDIFFLSIFAAILCWDVMGWTFFLLARFVRWCFRQLRAWRNDSTDNDIF